MPAVIGQFIRDEQGQDLIEYTLLLAFVVLTTGALAGGFHGSILGVTATTNSNLGAANAAAS